MCFKLGLIIVILDFFVAMCYLERLYIFGSLIFLGYSAYKKGIGPNTTFGLCIIYNTVMSKVNALYIFLYNICLCLRSSKDIVVISLTT